MAELEIRPRDLLSIIMQSLSVPNLVTDNFIAEPIRGNDPGSSTSGPNAFITSVFDDSAVGDGLSLTVRNTSDETDGRTIEIGGTITVDRSISLNGGGGNNTFSFVDLGTFQVSDATTTDIQSDAINIGRSSQ